MKIVASNDKGVEPMLWLWLGALSVEHRIWTGDGLVVTSLRRPFTGRVSKHSPPAGELVTAADLRRHALDDIGRTAEFCRMLQHRYGFYLGIVLEPEWLSPEQIADRGGAASVQPHVHIQLKVVEAPVSL